MDTPLVAKPCPGIVEVHAPVDADNVSASLRHQLQQTGCARAKMNGGCTGLFDRLEDALCVWLHKALVCAGAERSNPAIKYLHNIDTRLYLRNKGACNYLGQLVHQTIPPPPLPVHHRL